MKNKLFAGRGIFLFLITAALAVAGEYYVASNGTAFSFEQNTDGTWNSILGTWSKSDGFLPDSNQGGSQKNLTAKEVASFENSLMSEGYVYES